MFTLRTWCLVGWLACWSAVVCTTGFMMMSDPNKCKSTRRDLQYQCTTHRLPARLLTHSLAHSQRMLIGGRDSGKSASNNYTIHLGLSAGIKALHPSNINICIGVTELSHPLRVLRRAATLPADDPIDNNMPWGCIHIVRERLATIHGAAGTTCPDRPPAHWPFNRRRL